MNLPADATSIRQRDRRMARARYDLRASQIETPDKIVKFFWQILHQHRERLGTVYDMGAGDGRFARYGNYKRYVGVDIDSSRITNPQPRKSAIVKQGCVFARPHDLFDACIGNPPYLRHQDIESPWKEATLSMLGERLDVSLSGHSNLFLYFMALGLIRSAPTGITALVVPFDWVSRPSSRALHEVIRRHSWNVSIYRFAFDVFNDVETTASVSIVDKGTTNGLWSYYDVDDDLQVTRRSGVTGTGDSILRYTRREELFARRGMSPGNQKIFTLTDGERAHHGLTRDDVVPCVTTLRGIADDLPALDAQAFEQHFVAAGRRCWLIRSRDPLSHRLKRYLDGVPIEQRATATCVLRHSWYSYESVQPPAILVHSAFTSGGPRVLVNKIRAIPVGSMYGVYGCTEDDVGRLAAQLSSCRIFSRVVPHSGRLRKIEVGQLNSILKKLAHDARR